DLYRKLRNSLSEYTLEKYKRKLSLQRTNYIGNEIRTDGYYYHFTINNTVVYFLYKNGIILCAHSYSGQDLNLIEEEMVRIYPEIRKQKDGWGVFVVDGNKIEYEMWNASTGVSLPTIRCWGYIENDRTLRFTESHFSDMDKTYYDDEVWHFKQFDNKPDSTNVYIK
ncbi:MAG: hypothetical protein LBG15_11725, partial [Dysgonamonadaceae bacterium]|nr:hypothetical protein [Dysgonamonadaceae bacterium]